MQKNFHEFMGNFINEIDAFPGTLQDEDIEKLNNLLSRLQPILKEIQINIPQDFDPIQFTLMVEKLQSLIARVNTYEQAIIAENKTKQNQAGAAKAYEKGNRKK